MTFDYSNLSGRIVAKYGTQYNFAIAIGMSERSLSLKLNNKVPWKSTEIAKAARLLDIEADDIPKFFFKPKVQIFEHKNKQKGE